jgi:TIR domain
MAHRIVVADIFISYSKQQPEPTREVAAYLGSQGYSVWWDADLTSGEDFGHVIDRELDAAKAVIVIWTKGSIASKWVRAEARHADRDGKLIPLRTEDLDTSRIPKPYCEYHTDVVDDRAAILKAVRRVAGVPSSKTKSEDFTKSEDLTRSLEDLTRRLSRTPKFTQELWRNYQNVRKIRGGPTPQERRHMDCPVCGQTAEEILNTIDGVTVNCPDCREYDISSSAMAEKRWQDLEPEQRREALAKAKRSAQPGKRPLITSYLY